MVDKVGRGEGKGSRGHKVDKVGEGRGRGAGGIWWIKWGGGVEG